VITIGLVTLYPLSVLVRMSVSDVSILNLNDEWVFVGLDNYVRELTAREFATIFLQNVLYVGFVLSVGLGGGLVAALILQSPGAFPRAVATLMVFMWAMPSVVNGSIWRFLYTENGLINTILVGAHILPEPVLWLIDGRTALFSVGFVNSWVAIPFVAMVLRAALLDIPPELIEAAEIDGASPLQRIRYISIPMIRPAVLIVAMLMIINAFRSFDWVYLMTKGGPGTATTTLPVLSYQLTFQTFRFDLGAAVAVLAIVIVAPLSFLYIRTTLREFRQ
jgi:multiple sugar transport system permease protein